MDTRLERIAYFNGDYVPESSACVHFRDRGFVYGDAAFDTARTFNGRTYRLHDHIERLYRTLRYLRIDPLVPPAALATITEEVVTRNRPLLGPDEDYWVTQRVSRGPNFPDEPGQRPGPTVIVECVPLPLRARAPLFRDGADVVTPGLRRVPPECLSPNAKMQNYLNLIVAGFDADDAGEKAWPVLLDTRGFLCEGKGSNVFVVRGGRVLTPRWEYVLPGITRETTMTLCGDLGIPCEETDISPHDALTADEAFITSTSLCICPVGSFNGTRLGEGAVPGPVTRRLTEAFASEVGFDFREQYLRHLGAARTGLIASAETPR